MSDPECKKLADYFLQDEPLLKPDLDFAESLAIEIQEMIEGSIQLRKTEIRQEQRAKEGD